MAYCHQVSGWKRFHFGTRTRQHEVAGVAKVILDGAREKSVSILSGSAWHDTIF
jgi:hypothetical protein